MFLVLTSIAVHYPGSPWSERWNNRNDARHDYLPGFWLFTCIDVIRSVLVQSGRNFLCIAPRVGTTGVQ
jgi:hypothetical protein